MDEANVKLNANAISVFRSACSCLSDAPVSIVASSRSQVWCISPTEAVPATLCIFECAGATWFAGWHCSASSVDLEHYAKLRRHLERTAAATSSSSSSSSGVDLSGYADMELPAGETSTHVSSSQPPSSLTAQTEDKVAGLISHVPVCWIRSTFHSLPPNSAQQKKSSDPTATRVDAVIYTVGASKKNAAAMVPRVIVLSSVSTQFAQCLANVVAEHGGRCGSLPDASVFESLSSLRGEIVTKSVQLPFFTVAPESGLDRVTAQLPVLAETLALFEGSLYKPCVVIFHTAAMWTTADKPATDFMTSLGAQCITVTQAAVFFLSLPTHLPNPAATSYTSASSDLRARAQLDSHFCGGARLRLFDIDTINLCSDGRTVLIVSRNGCSTTQKVSDEQTILASPAVVLRVLFPHRDTRAVFVSNVVNQCQSIKHAVLVISDDQEHETSSSSPFLNSSVDTRVPKTILNLDLNGNDYEIVDIGSAVAVADTDFCTSIECSTRPMWPVTFPVFADGYELTEFWKLLSLHTCTLLVKLSKIVPTSSHSSLALRVSSCVTDIIGDRWGKAFLIHRAATVVANCAVNPDKRRDDATLSLQLLRFLLVDCSVLVSRACAEPATIMEAKDKISTTLRDVEAITCSRTQNTTDRNVPLVRWEKILEQVLLVLSEGALALGSDSDLVLSVVAPFADSSAFTKHQEHYHQHQQQQQQQQQSQERGNYSYYNASSHSFSLTPSHNNNNNNNNASPSSPTSATSASQQKGAEEYLFANMKNIPLADLSKMDLHMSTALSAFPASLFCATHPLPALWRLVRPFLLPILRSFFTRESFDSMFPSTSADLLSPSQHRLAIQRQGLVGGVTESPFLKKYSSSSSSSPSSSSSAAEIDYRHQYQNNNNNNLIQAKEVGTLTEDTETQTVDSPLWKLLRNSSSDEIESATAGQIYINRLFGRSSLNHNNTNSTQGAGGGLLETNNNKLPSAPIVEDWLQLAQMVQGGSTSHFASSSSNPSSPHRQQQLGISLISATSAASAAAGGGGGEQQKFQMGGDSYFAGTPALNTPLAGSTPIQSRISPQVGGGGFDLNVNASPSSALILERRDTKINELEMKEQTLQATISALHDELANSRGEITQLLMERRNYKSTLMRERCDRLLEQEVSERQVLMSQEEVDRCGLHNFLVDRAILESVNLIGEAAYRTLPPSAVSAATHNNAAATTSAASPSSSPSSASGFRNNMSGYARY